jgi:hypothetical protein
MTEISCGASSRFLDFLAFPGHCLEIIGFAGDLDINPNILLSGADDTQHSVVRASEIYISQ